MFYINLFSFAISMWLGLFLLTRGTHLRLRFTGLGLIFYAAALIISIQNISPALRLLPPILWVGTILHIDEHISDNHRIMHKLWMWLLIPVTILIGGFFLLDTTASLDFPYRWISLFIGFTPLIWTLVLIQDYMIIFQPKQAAGKDLADYEKDALKWFQSFVPERTLHNWQNTAARLIANDLWQSNWQ